MSDDAPASVPPPAGTASAKPWVAILVGSAYVVCLVRLAGFVAANSVNLMYSDQWDALWPLFEGRGPWTMFLHQHGPVRLGLGGVINWWLYTTTGWDVRAEAWSGAVMLALAAGVALVLAARLRGRLAWTDAAFPLLLLSLVQWETLILTTFPGAQILPLLLILLVAWSWSLDDAIARGLGVGLGGALALFSGYGVVSAPATVGLAALLWLRPGSERPAADRRAAVVALILMGAAVIAFASSYHFASGNGDFRFPVPNWWDYPRFCALMFTNLFGWRAITTASVTVGAVLLAPVVIAFVAATLRLWRRRAGPRVRVAWFLTGATLAYAALTAVGRLPTTIEAAFMWRYTSLLLPGVCGVGLLAEEWARTRGPRWGVGFGVMWLAVAGVVWGNFTPEVYAASLAKAKRLWVESYLQTHNLAAANHLADFGIYPDANSPVLAEKLRLLDERHLSFFKDAPAKE
ncbi:MAG TPA: hypothetical protein VG734_18650 [Lacunisphaera sp.]|nr:hypothetical protein [Lacunisphaera sp.]